MPEAISTALKEWAAVNRAVVAGDQIVLVRKGGIAEKRFELPSERFVLFPTQFHQPENQFRPEFAHHVSGDGAEPARISIEAWAEVVRLYRIDELEKLVALAPHVIFTEETIRDRYAFRPRQAMHVMALRAFRLPHPVTLPQDPAYAGCRSWIELPPVNVEGSQQVLENDELASRIVALDQLLG